MVENISNTDFDIIGLYRNDYFNEFHIREMARLLGKSHVTLLPYLKKFEKNKILMVKQVGKSRVYSLNLDNNQTKEFLSLSEKKKSIELLNKEFFVKIIYDKFVGMNLNGCLILFGSYAIGNRTKESDIDLLYIGVIKEKDKKKLREFGKLYNREIHLMFMPLQQFKEQLLKKGTLIKEIIKTHIILYNHDIFINELWRYYHERKV